MFNIFLNPYTKVHNAKGHENDSKNEAQNIFLISQNQCIPKQPKTANGNQRNQASQKLLLESLMIRQIMIVIIAVMIVIVIVVSIVIIIIVVVISLILSKRDILSIRSVLIIIFHTLPLSKTDYF